MIIYDQLLLTTHNSKVHHSIGVSCIKIHTKCKLQIQTHLRLPQLFPVGVQNTLNKLLYLFYPPKSEFQFT